jgi:predicted ribosomally synthesized peptide with SipW-like signal peptide
MRNKFAVLAILLIVALAATSVGYAYWTETIDINGTVQAGNLDVAFVDDAPTTPTTSDNENSLDVATCSADVSDDGNELVIEIGNAYPGYECYIDFGVENVGSIPVDLNEIVLGAVDDALEVTPVGVSADNLAVGGTIDGMIMVKVNESAVEGETYTFSASILAEQFNAQ